MLKIKKVLETKANNKLNYLILTMFTKSNCIYLENIHKLIQQYQLFANNRSRIDCITVQKAKSYTKKHRR